MDRKQIPYQVNPSGLVALLPTGKVRFLHPSAKPHIDHFNRSEGGNCPVDFEAYELDELYVDLEQFHLTAPAIAFIETTNLCNLQCLHCYAWSGKKRKNEMSTKQIKGLIDEFSELGVLQVFLTGGELFAHHDALELIQYARSKPFSTQIFTNGLLITEEHLKNIPSGQSFFISFDTAEPDRTVRGRMDYPRLRKCFDLMDKYGHIYRTAVSAHAMNVQDIEGIFAWCAEHGYPRPQWLETHPIGRALINPHIMLSKEKVDEVVAVYERCMDRYHRAPEQILENLNDDMTNNSTEMIRGVDTIKFCQSLEKATNQEKCGRSVVYINSAGEVFPCSNCMSNSVYKAGNVTNGSFVDIWREGFADFRNITFADYHVCQNCDVNKEDIWCQFRCPPLAQNVSGDEKGCGATEYLRLFMLRSNQYWKKRREKGYTLSLIATSN